MANRSSTGMAQSSNQPQRNHFQCTSDGKLKFTQNGVEKYMVDSVVKEGIEEMKRCMHEYQGKPRKWDTLSPTQRALDFDLFTQKYQESEDSRKLVQFIQKNVLSTKSLQIRTCIVAGLGSFNTSVRALAQLVAFEVIFDVLRREFDIREIIVQDPAMEQLDEEFIKSRGYTVVKHPEAQNAIDETTFLFCPGISWVTIWEFLVVGRPCLYYGPRQEDLEHMLMHYGGGWSVEGTKEDRWNNEFLRFKAGRKSMEMVLAEADQGPKNEFVWLNERSG
ncbi:MAG: hypothetical protein Q9184_004427 [Pyrenodesmia sp. 2 TL-2023]